ncbi:OmpA family protein [Tunturibacter empetritectus]|uniref:Outer membrane protein OmpA-like peptidoglycan-associated protein n=1 Tax=Tunturiibacter empetritectus TaxID=3069691 RepID=A0A7W8IJ38_9BACT|nr:OmpA family protein [Edaphobacter lichenicola]MBB5318004.1 outer membrane protein OmpA-like peptidoglycan-associated protein [Edaphobacter lichenicola]
MAGSIVESLMGLLGPQVLGPVASQLGESTDTVQRGLQTGSAAMLAGLVAKVGQPGFLGQIFSLITNPANGPSALSGLTSNLGSLASGATSSPVANLGSQFLSSIFGSNMSSVTDSIGRSVGVSSGKAGSLLAMAAPLVLGVLGQHVRQNNLSAADLGSTLKAEAPSFQRFLPAGLGSLMGGASNLASNLTAAVPAKVATGNRWLWPVVLLAALLLCLFWFFNRTKAPVSDAVQPASIAAANAGSSATSALGDFFKTKLPDGVELNIPQLGIESKLISFLGDSSKPVDTTTWFNFDRLLFDTGKATLQPSSQEQLNNVAAILKAYPHVHVKLGGYTDNTGNAAANVALSGARAKNVMDALVAAGVDPSRLQSKGYGDEHPVGDNATEEGRAQNRRIAMLVTQK